jgi:hypothetical protein
MNCWDSADQLSVNIDGLEINIRLFYFEVFLSPFILAVGFFFFCAFSWSKNKKLTTQLSLRLIKHHATMTYGGL